MRRIINHIVGMTVEPMDLKGQFAAAVTSKYTSDMYYSYIPDVYTLLPARDSLSNKFRAAVLRQNLAAPFHLFGQGFSPEESEENLLEEIRRYLMRGRLVEFVARPGQSHNDLDPSSTYKFIYHKDRAHNHSDTPELYDFIYPLLLSGGVVERGGLDDLHCHLMRTAF